MTNESVLDLKGCATKSHYNVIHKPHVYHNVHNMYKCDKKASFNNVTLSKNTNQLFNVINNHKNKISNIQQHLTT